MKRSCLCILLLFSVLAVAQEINSIQKKIDQEVWKPFQEAFEKRDAKSLNELYASEVLRVTPIGIDTSNQFKDTNVQRFTTYKANNTKLALAFWFDSRHTNPTTSYEVGFYRIKLTAEEKVNTIYGQFHIVLKKINGIWKITQDWDTAEINGATIGSKDFEKQNPMKF